MLKSLLVMTVVAVAPFTVQVQAVEHPIGRAGALVRYCDADVTVRDKDGKLVVVAMAKGWTVVTARPVPLDAVRPGDFVATINRNVDATTGRASELRLFEPGYRPEVGTHDMPLPGTSITHGTVVKARKSQAGLELDVTYPGGGRRIQVPADIQPIAYDVHPRDFAKPGVSVSAVTRRDADGVWRAGRIMIQP
ncbi:hypothetical protein [Caulobacter sp. LARHSG274]